MPMAQGPDKFGECPGEQDGTEHTGNAADAAHGALKLALFGRADAAAHQSLGGWAGDAPKRHHGNAEPKNPAVGGQAVDGEAKCAKQETNNEGASLSEMPDDAADEGCLNDAEANAHGGEHEADSSGTPVVTIIGVVDKSAGKGIVGEGGKKGCAREAKEFVMGAQKFEGAERIGALPREGSALVAAQ